MRAKKSVMQLETLRVDNIRLEWYLSALEDEKNLDPAKYSVNLDFDVVPVDKEGKSYGIRFLIKVNERKKSVPFKAQAELHGTFRFLKDDLSEERKIRYLLLNGLSMLYSFARGYFFAKLDSLPPDARLLPTVDMLSVVERKAEEAKKRAEKAQ